MAVPILTPAVDQSVGCEPASVVVSSHELTELVVPEDLHGFRDPPEAIGAWLVLSVP
jgi:hypothetical protein